MRSGARFLWVALVSVGCGGEAPRPAIPPPPVHASAPAAERARWAFARPEWNINAKLDLAEQGVLYVGRNGRRELAKNGEMKDASTLAIGDLVGVMRDARGGFVFVADDGTTYAAKEPLGPLDRLHRGPRPDGEKLAVAVGRSAIVAVVDGKLVRSTDLGATWEPVAYAGSNPPFGHAGLVALDSKGNGVLVHFPQRLFVTHDDGATWSPLASAGTGAVGVRRDGHDAIFVEGFDLNARSPRAKLEGDTLVATAEQPADIYPLPSTSEPEAHFEARHALATGSRRVELREIYADKRAIYVGSAPLGQKIEKFVVVPDLAGAAGLEPWDVSASGPELAYLRQDDDPDATVATSTILRSKDYGVTWQADGQLDGVRLGREPLVLGPKGWIYVGGLCARGSTDGVPCNERKVRPAGAKAFEDVKPSAHFMRFAFDEAHDRVYAVGDVGGHARLFVSPLERNEFVELDAFEGTTNDVGALTVDALGSPHVLEWSDDRAAWLLHRADASGKRRESLELPATLTHGELAFAGARGLLFGRRGIGWETADAGETWTRVATNDNADAPSCSAMGCINGDAQRIGWDLPALQNGNALAARPAPAQTAKPPKPPKRTGSCKVAGSASAIGEIGEIETDLGSYRWAVFQRGKEGRLSIAFADKTAVHVLPLLGAFPKPPVINTRTGMALDESGAIAARYTFAPRRVTGHFNPVDVELAWWSALTGRARHHTLRKVSPFRVSRYEISGTAKIVPGGILFQGAPDDAAYFLRDDDKVERVALPPRSPGIKRAVDRVGARWVIADGDAATEHLSTSEDGGKTWKSATWSLDPSGVASLGRLGDEPVVLYSKTSPYPALAFRIDASLPSDPPAPVVFDESAIDDVCDARALSLHASGLVGEPVPLILDVAGTKLSSSARLVRASPGGKLCAESYSLRSAGAGPFAHAYADGTGWRFREPASSGFVAEPLTCSVTP